MSNESKTNAHLRRITSHLENRVKVINSSITSDAPAFHHATTQNRPQRNRNGLIHFSLVHTLGLVCVCILMIDLESLFVDAWASQHMRTRIYDTAHMCRFEQRVRIRMLT